MPQNVSEFVWQRLHEWGQNFFRRANSAGHSGPVLQPSHHHREGQGRFQRARNVVVAGYAVETPRVLPNSAKERSADGLANSSGLVGKNLMTARSSPPWAA